MKRNKDLVQYGCFYRLRPVVLSFLVVSWQETKSQTDRILFQTRFFQYPKRYSPVPLPLIVVETKTYTVSLPDGALVIMGDGFVWE